ncbi:phosphate acetyltransferase [Olsenella massiliensis]|uniref:phosphate acetyltransferase n=1 Tax=Olsenella massiliensis TaxID=1622075 RepID=UPI00071E4EC4|nr:phosphate acetyltransferase [Olsenella massiliensis]
MSEWIEKVKDRAKKQKKTIVLPESEDPRVIEAAKKALAAGIANIVILGDSDKVDVPGATVINPRHSDKHEAYAQKFAKLRARKGVTIVQARESMNDATYFGMMMVKMGDADGLVSGACHSTANTLRPALQILKTAPDAKLVSAFFVVCSPKHEYGDKGTLIFADSGLNIDPTAEELVEIAASTAKTWRGFMEDEPRIGMMSFTTMGSAKGAVPDKMQEATRLANKRYPELELDGDLQVDAALVPEVATIKAPHSHVAGKVNIMIFPDLACGNISYKLVQRFGDAEAYGPLLQGIAKPVNDLSRGCSSDDIVGVIAITCVQAQMMDAAKAKAESEA